MPIARCNIDMANAMLQKLRQQSSTSVLYRQMLSVNTFNFNSVYEVAVLRYIVVENR